MGPSIPIHWMSPFPILGVSSCTFFSFLFLIVIHVYKANSEDPDQTPVVFDLGLQCLPMSQKKGHQANLS